LVHASQFADHVAQPRNLALRFIQLVLQAFVFAGLLAQFAFELFDAVLALLGADGNRGRRQRGLG
jgi:hypothetical protein